MTLGYKKIVAPVLGALSVYLMLSFSLGLLALGKVSCHIIRQPCGEAHMSSFGSGCFEACRQSLSELGSRFFPS